MPTTMLTTTPARVRPFGVSRGVVLGLFTIVPTTTSTALLTYLLNVPRVRWFPIG